MGLLDFLLGGDDSSSDAGRDWDRSVFDSDRFRNNGSGNWVDWEDVSTEGTMATDLSILIMMRMESGSYGISFKLYDLQ